MLSGHSAAQEIKHLLVHKSSILSEVSISPRGPKPALLRLASFLLQAPSIPMKEIQHVVFL